MYKMGGCINNNQSCKIGLSSICLNLNCSKIKNGLFTQIKIIKKKISKKDKLYKSPTFLL